MMFNTTPLPDAPLRRAALTLITLATLAAAPAAAQTPAATIEDAEGETLWQLNDDGGFVVLGERSNGTIPIEGTGVRLMWHPAKAAFRAGLTNGDEWDNDNVGHYSTAMGSGTTASNFASTAMGSGTTASGHRSTAMGFSTTASGINSTAMGQRTVAATAHSLATGVYNVANQNDDGTLFVVGNGSTDFDRSDALVLDDSGDLWIAGTLTEASDRRLKTDIAPLEGDVLDALAEIRPVRYRFRAGTGHPTDAQIGLIAQEVQQHFPELVSEDSDGHLSLSYSKLTAVLVKGLQEQQAQIEALQARAERVDVLEARLAALEAGHTGQHARWGWPAGALVLGLVLVGGVAWRCRP